MKFSLPRFRLLIFTAIALTISLVVGLIAGEFLKSRSENTTAASANITVADNDQTITYDQSADIITVERQSIVTIRNPIAAYGYTIRARLSGSPSPIPSSTVFISPATLPTAATSPCSTDTPCTLPSDGSFIDILTTTSPDATEAVHGDTTTFNITITVPAATLPNDYIIDIEYSEQALYDPYIGLVDGSNIQDATPEQVANTPPGMIVNLKDTRDGKYYRVKKMIDGNCWMVDNLAYDINSAPAEGKPAYDSTPVLVSGIMASAENIAQYVQSSSTFNIPNNGSPTPSYLYNWCAALGDTSPDCRASATHDATANPYGAQDLQTVLDGVATTTATSTDQPDVTGICPSPFRLPKGGPGATSSDPATTANEFAKLDIAMGGIGANRYPDIPLYDLWTGTGADNTNWLGVLTGHYYANNLSIEGLVGDWWTSTGASVDNAYHLGVNITNYSVHPVHFSIRPKSFAVRCLLSPSL